MNVFLTFTYVCPAFRYSILILTNYTGRTTSLIHQTRVQVCFNQQVHFFKLVSIFGSIKNSTKTPGRQKCMEIINKLMLLYLLHLYVDQSI